MGVAAGVLGALVAAAKPKPAPIIATDAELAARLTANANTQRRVMRDFIAQHLIPLDDDLQDPAKFDFGIRIGKLRRDPSQVAWVPPVVNTLPTSTPSRMDHKLGRMYDFDIRFAARIVSDYRNDPGHSWSFPANADEAKKQFLELVALEALYIRTMAAINASKAAQVPLADALALFRREGDLVAPMSQAHIDDRLPPFERLFKFNLTPTHHIQIKSTMVNGLWSYPKKAFHKTFKTAALEVSDPAVFGAVVIVACLLQWHMIVVGFDFIGTIAAEKPNLIEVLKAYIDLAQTVYRLNGIASTKADREAAFDTQGSNLVLTEVNGRLVVAPTDPVVLLTYILTFALLFGKLAGKKEVRGPFLPPPAALMYLAHHTSDTRDFDDPQKDKFSWILASGAVALANLPAAPAYCPAAYAKVKTLGLPAELPGIQRFSKVASDKHATAAKALKDNLSASEMDELAQFVLRAEAADWDGFKTHRANIANYARIHAYYEVVTAP